MTAGLLPAMTTLDAGTLDPCQEDSTAAPWEYVASWIIYGPLVTFWIAMGLRYRDFAIATLANPHIPTGGLCGESKSGILSQFPTSESTWVAPWQVFTTGQDSMRRAADAMERLDLSFPVVLKPDIGCKGAGVRLIRTQDRLSETLALYPDNIPVMIQHFIPYEGEAGIFYSRLPNEDIGQILSMTFKSSPFVVGNGVSTLHELILDHPRAGTVPHVYLPRLTGRLDEVPSPGEVVSLVFTGNHSKGSLFRDATHLITPALTKRIDAILRRLPDSHHGRVDLRFASVEALREGRQFQIIEVNGIDSEPIHMWASGTTLASIWRTQFRFYGRAFRIGALMRQRGFRSKGAFDMLRQWRRQSALIARYPSSD
ncbi:ATP-grasp domain-containing protein [Gluconacetobacter liquefaciens]|nr:ATP-grasp domain-containing protein [Gluconacetobacter liquefaciens]